MAPSLSRCPGTPGARCGGSGVNPPAASPNSLGESAPKFCSLAPVQEFNVKALLSGSNVGQPTYNSGRINDDPIVSSDDSAKFYLEVTYYTQLSVEGPNR